MKSAALQRLLDIMQTLRDPQQGCPWDRQQTFATIAPYTLEETYEVLDAIARNDDQDLRDELGDLLFQVVFYAQIAQEQGKFNFDDICQSISDKLERRHPLIFPQPGNRKETTMLSWEQLKTQERAQKSQHSLLDDIPHALPALMQADKIQRRCATVGFDWQQLAPVVDKVHEEIAEVMHEVQQPVIDQEKLHEEIGDLLFATVNLSRHLGQNAEEALQNANRKFSRRFQQVETIISQTGISMEQATLLQMEAAWQQVKTAEKA